MQRQVLEREWTTYRYPAQKPPEPPRLIRCASVSCSCTGIAFSPRPYLTLGKWQKHVHASLAELVRDLGLGGEALERMIREERAREHQAARNR